MGIRCILLISCKCINIYKRITLCITRHWNFINFYKHNIEYILSTTYTCSNKYSILNIIVIYIVHMLQFYYINTVSQHCCNIIY